MSLAITTHTKHDDNAFILRKGMRGIFYIEKSEWSNSCFNISNHLAITNRRAIGHTMFPLIGAGCVYCFSEISDPALIGGWNLPC